MHQIQYIIPPIHENTIVNTTTTTLFVTGWPARRRVRSICTRTSGWSYSARVTSTQPPTTRPRARDSNSGPSQRDPPIQSFRPESRIWAHNRHWQHWQRSGQTHPQTFLPPKNLYQGKIYILKNFVTKRCKKKSFVRYSKTK